MTEGEILRNLFKAVQSAAHKEIQLKVVVAHVKTKPLAWSVWQKNKVHLVTFFTREWKRARKQENLAA